MKLWDFSLCNTLNVLKSFDKNVKTIPSLFRILENAINVMLIYLQYLLDIAKLSYHSNVLHASAYCVNFEHVQHIIKYFSVDVKQNFIVCFY